MQAKPVQKTIGGVAFEDRFAHLHEDSAEVLDWQWESDRIAQEASQASPNYSAVRDRMLELSSGDGLFSVRKRGGLWFALATEDGDMVMRVSETPGGPSRTIMSKREATEAAGAHEALMLMFEPSPDGRFVAISLGFDGSPMGKWAAYDVATGRHIRDSSPVFTGIARPTWLPDGSGFWLNDRTAEGLHRFHYVAVAEGAAARADILLPGDIVSPAVLGLSLDISPDGRRGLAVTEYTESVARALIDLETGEVAPFLPENWTGNCGGSWIDDDSYAARVNDTGPRGRVVAIPVATSADASTWRELVAQGEGIIEWAGVVAGRMYVGDQIDVSLRIRVFDLDGILLQTLPLESPGSSPSLSFERTVRPADIFAFTHATFTQSQTACYHDAETGELRGFGEASVRLDDLVAEPRFATSRDGTRISYFIVRRKDLDLGRPHPALVHAYAGFNTALQPSLPLPQIPFIEAGGIYVQPALRGGAEYGKEWHDAGRLTNKQNTFDDLEAVAEALIADGLSSPDRMAFTGSSNGGMLAGIAIVHQPHLWRVVAPLVPLFDMMEAIPAEAAMMRAALDDEFGNVDTPEVANSIFSWSPYHNIRDGTAYPAVFMQAGEIDQNCRPYHSRKFYARLSEANGGEHPIHLRVFRDSGHLIVDPKASALFHAEWLAFVMDQVGLTAGRPGT